MSRRLLICLPWLIASASATAQVYKVVGPDGKVNFTDRPPAAANGNVLLIRSGVARPLPPALTVGQEVAARQGTPASTVQPAQPAAAGTESRAPVLSEQEKARLQGALRIVLGRKALVEGAATMCGESLPSSLKRYVAAHDGWKKRNEPFLAKAETVLSTTMAAERAQLEKNTKAATDTMLQSVRTQDEQRRTGWCDGTADEINSKVIDLKDVPLVQSMM